MVSVLFVSQSGLRVWVKQGFYILWPISPTSDFCTVRHSELKTLIPVESGDLVGA